MDCSRKKPPGSHRNVAHASDGLLVGADEVAFHAPAADEKVQSTERGVWLRQSGALGHGTSSFLVVVPKTTLSDIQRVQAAELIGAAMSSRSG